MVDVPEILYSWLKIKNKKDTKNEVQKFKIVQQRFNYL